MPRPTIPRESAETLIAATLLNAQMNVGLALAMAGLAFLLFGVGAALLAGGTALSVGAVFDMRAAAR